MPDENDIREFQKSGGNIIGERINFQSYAGRVRWSHWPLGSQSRESWDVNIKQNSISIIAAGFLYRKDVRLPVQLQRAMAAEAEAAREARAKVRKYFYLWQTALEILSCWKYFFFLRAYWDGNVCYFQNFQSIYKFSHILKSFEEYRALILM